MAEISVDKADTTENERPQLFSSDEPEDRVASTPSTSESEAQDDDDIITLGPFSPNRKWGIDVGKHMQMPFSERLSEKNELSIMSFGRQSADYFDSNVIGPSMPWTDIPRNLSFSDDLYNKLKSHRRTRSSTYCNDVPVKYTSGFGQGKLFIPFAKQIRGCGEGNDNRAMVNLLERSLVTHLNSPDKSTDTADRATRLLDKRNTQQLGGLSKSPSSLGHVALQKPRVGGGHHPAKRRSLSRVSDMTYLSCSSSLSTCSYESVSTQYSAISQAVLRCLWNKGTPYFVYTVADDLDEVYVASRWKVKSLDDKALDYIYLFYTRTGQKTAPHIKVSPYHLVGKMKVSSSVTFVSSKSSIRESEFVLFGSAQHDHRGQLLSSKSGTVKNHGFSKNLFNSLRANYSRHQNSLPRHMDSSSPEFEDPMKETLGDEFNQFLSDPIGVTHFQPHSEMAAVVIRSHQNDSDKEMASGGWGLKFLEKQKDVNVGCSPKLSYPIGNLGSAEVKSTTQAVNVLIPAGLHGGAQSGSVGPSRLVDRWKTGGKCDCGGWDLGCPLTVLCDGSTKSNFRSEEPLVDLFVEGSKQAEPALRIVDVQEGLYVVYSHANISVMQSFSIAISVIHSQIPSLCPC